MLCYVNKQSGPNAKRDASAAKKTPANSEKPQQKAQETRWASPRRQNQQQTPADDVTGEAGPRSQAQRPRRAAGDKVPAEKKSAPTAASDGDAACPDKDDEKSREPDNSVTKNGYVRVIRDVGK